MAKKSGDDRARLEALIEEAIVDCYDEEEQQTGMMCALEENVVCPFKALVIGEEVEVVALKPRSSGFGIDAICQVKGKEHKIDINSLEWPKKKPKGYEWIEAYKLWQSNIG